MSVSFRDDFDAGLDPQAWLPSYLPHWSSREAAAATWSVDDSALLLSIPPAQGQWCEGIHERALRVSGVQSGAFSGPVGSTTGQQPFAEGLVVQEEQPLWTGWTWDGGPLQVRARMELSPRSMASVWMIGVEDAPERCGEVCLFEVFGAAVSADGAEVGQGVHPFRDPALSEDFDAPWAPIDVAHWHTYGADWHSDRVDFLIDGSVTRTVPQSPTYPLQMMIAVFDFPDLATPADEHHVPRLLVDKVRAGAPAQP